MKFLLPMVVGSIMLFPCSPAQEAPLPAEDRTVANLPQWLVDFSNLPRDKREQYLRAFNNAKQAYQRGQWTACISYLTDCEMLFRGNPNVWNLRACCLMEQKYFAEAAAEMKRVRKALPNDPVTTLNMANIHMAMGRYEDSIETLNELQNMLPYGTPPEVYNVLIFRKLICNVMLGREQDAKELVAHVHSLSDTPLYYYSQVVFSLAKGNRIEAAQHLQTAGSIFSQGNRLIPYQRTLELSGIINKQPSPAAQAQ